MNEVWSELLAYETKDLVKRYMKKRHGREPNDAQVAQINANFIQARQYFLNAAEANATVRPLLQYYGVMSLSRGLILALSPELREEHLKPSHGLCVKNWNAVISTKNYEDILIQIGEGTFTELMTSTKNANYLRANSNKVNYTASLTPPPIDYTIRLKDVIEYFPDLQEQLESWLDERFPLMILKSLKSNNNICTAKLWSTTFDGHINQFFPPEHCKNLKIENHKHELTIEYETMGWYPNITQLWNGAFGIGDVCIVRVPPGDKGLNLLCAMYMVAYVFGMMARYYPSVWVNIQRGGNGDKLYPFTCQVFDFIQLRYPSQVLDFLRAPYVFEANRSELQ